MPIYEFVCESCGNEFEKIVSFSATTTPSCPSCQGREVMRRIGRPAIHFKGSGWYITDSKQSNGKHANGKDKSESNGEAKSETPAAESTKSETTSSDTSAAKADA